MEQNNQTGTTNFFTSLDALEDEIRIASDRVKYSSKSYRPTLSHYKHLINLLIGSLELHRAQERMVETYATEMGRRLKEKDSEIENINGLNEEYQTQIKYQRATIAELQMQVEQWKNIHKNDNTRSDDSIVEKIKTEFMSEFSKIVNKYNEGYEKELKKHRKTICELSDKVESMEKKLCSIIRFQIGKLVILK